MFQYNSYTHIHNFNKIVTEYESARVCMWSVKDAIASLTDHCDWKHIMIIIIIRV